LAARRAGAAGRGGGAPRARRARARHGACTRAAWRIRGVACCPHAFGRTFGCAPRSECVPRSRAARRDAQVQFGRKLAAECVPEWAGAYIDYARLKQLLAAVRDADADQHDEDPDSLFYFSDDAPAADSAAHDRGAGGVRSLLSSLSTSLRRGDSFQRGGPLSRVLLSFQRGPAPRVRWRNAVSLITVRRSEPGPEGAPQARRGTRACTAAAARASGCCAAWFCCAC
jgi:hypothetical protein